MIYLLLAIVLVIIAGLVAKLYDGDFGVHFMIGLFIFSFTLVGMIQETIPPSSNKGYIVFPVYKVSGNDTISTTYYVREKK